ncbi:MAG: leucyl aminopeptidase [Deltaproteobacteria bacterium]|nr:leucyl aminopeptidase [Deltaproteobacteria bacterium]
MNIVFSKKKPLESKGDAVVLFKFEGEELHDLLGAIDSEFGGEIKRLLSREEFKAKEGDVFSFYTFSRIPASQVVIFGAGKRADFGSAAALRLGSNIGKYLRKKGIGEAVFAADGKIGAELVARIAAGIGLGAYRFRKRSKEKKKEKGLKICFCGAAGRGGIERWAGLARAVNFARDLVNEPACDVTPQRLVREARKIAKREGLGIRVYSGDELLKKKMRLIHAVGESGKYEPALIHLEYAPANRAKNRKSRKGFRSYRHEGDKGAIAVIGKGVTFDGGGFHLKTRGNIEDMKHDMAGAAAVMAVMGIIKGLAPDFAVHGIIPAVENILEDDSIKPGDVIEAMSGKTVEVVDTDAEGRLIIADALRYAKECGAETAIDVATLTGSCAVALGEFAAGLFSNDDGLADRILKAAESAGEDIWRLPLYKKLRKQLESDVADLKNVGKRYGGAITGALFIEEFAEGMKWAHLDIAGPAYHESEDDLGPRGATGFGVMTLAELLKQDWRG